MAVTDSKRSELISTLSDTNSGKSLRKYIEGDMPREQLSVADIITPLQESSAPICISFVTRDGTHYVTQSNGKLRAVYMGKHGAENRPTTLNIETIEQLMKYSIEVEVNLVKETRLSESVVAGFL